MVCKNAVNLHIMFVIVLNFYGAEYLDIRSISTLRWSIIALTNRRTTNEGVRAAIHM